MLPEFHATRTTSQNLKVKKTVSGLAYSFGLQVGTPFIDQVNEKTLDPAFQVLCSLFAAVGVCKKSPFGAGPYV